MAGNPLCSPYPHPGTFPYTHCWGSIPLLLQPPFPLVPLPPLLAGWAVAFREAAGCLATPWHAGSRGMELPVGGLHMPSGVAGAVTPALAPGPSTYSSSEHSLAALCSPLAAELRVKGAACMSPVHPTLRLSGSPRSHLLEGCLTWGQGMGLSLQKHATRPSGLAGPLASLQA